jgi:hypothetical protein
MRSLVIFAHAPSHDATVVVCDTGVTGQAAALRCTQASAGTFLLQTAQDDVAGCPSCCARTDAGPTRAKRLAGCCGARLLLQPLSASAGHWAS